MVFSFFKKPPEKMVARPAAAPVRAKPEPTPAAGPAGMPGSAEEKDAPRELAPLDFTTSNIKSPAAAPAAPAMVSPSDFSDLSESPEGFHVEMDVDPVEADVEQAAVLYANGQDAATGAVLENAVHVHHFGPGERLWLMLFDFYRLTNQHAPFDALGIEYARAFEKSPPVWRGAEAPKAAPKPTAFSGTVIFKGSLTGENDAAFAALDEAIEKNPKLRVELNRVKEIDDLGAERMLGVLEMVRKKKREVELVGRDAVASLIETKIAVGTRENAGCWLLLLEFYQIMGKETEFEDMAINYAVTFEMSPPSWDPKRVAKAEPKPLPAAAVDGADEEEDAASSAAFVLRGDLKSERFGGLPAVAEKEDPVVIDFSAVTRIDFVSAGTLVNLLTPAKRAGKRVIIKHPNHLVAELLGVVGLKAVAEVVFAKN
ncbi:MAG TPA: STAS domain-containing protein [Azospira sp.]|nr:STAS domain-containing protein [Azospira sp.]HNN45657.1 STAS domain-containing protein [Azospira sp.]